MSDWKSRAKPVSNGTNDWKSRSKPIDYEAEATIAAEKKYEETKPGALEAAAYGVTQGATRNFADDLAGLVGGNAAKAALQDRVKRSKEEQPLAYGTGEVASKIATLPATLNPLGAAAVAGMDTVASTVGDAEDKLSVDTVKKAATRGSIDAATAGALAKISPVLSAKLSQYGDDGAAWLSKIMDKAGNKQLVKSLGGTKGQIEKLGSKVDDVGDMLYKEDIVTPLASSKTIADRVSTRAQDLADEMAPIYKASKDSNLPTAELLQSIDNRIAELRSNPANAPLISKLEGYKANIGDAGNISYNPSELKAFRQGNAKNVNFQSDAPTQLGKQEMNWLLRDAEMNQIAKVDPKLMKANEDLFRQVHLNSLAEEMADKGAARSAVNNEIGLNTWQAGTIAAAAEASSPKIALMMAAREMGKRYGNQLAGNGLKKAAEVIEGTQFAPMFAKAAERGPQAVIALHQALRSNPEYQKLVGDE